MKKDKLFFQIMKKIFLGHHKELRILILCETILTAISYAIVSGYQIFSNGHSSEYFMQEDGISKSFLSAGTIIILRNYTDYHSSYIISWKAYSGICIFTDRKSVV